MFLQKIPDIQIIAKRSPIMTVSRENISSGITLGRGGLKVPEAITGPDFGPQEFLTFFHGLWELNSDLHLPEDVVAYYGRTVAERHLVVPEPTVVFTYSAAPRQHLYDSPTETFKVRTSPQEVGDFKTQTSISHYLAAEGTASNRAHLVVEHGDETTQFRVLEPNDEFYKYSRQERAEQWPVLSAVVSQVVEITR
jgi:hypothetical protein